MESCDIRKKHSRMQNTLATIKSSLGKNTDIQRLMPFIDDLAILITTQKHDILQDKIHNLDSVADTADGIVKELTFGTYDTMDALRNAPAGFEKFLSARLTAKIGAYAATVDDPDKIIAKAHFSNDFANVLKFMYNYKNKANRTLFGFLPMSSIKKIHMFASNFGKTFKQHPQIYKIYQRMESISNTMTALTSVYHGRLIQITDEVAHVTGFDKIMPSTHLSKLARLKDPNVVEPSAIDTEIKSYLDKNNIDVTADDMKIIRLAMDRFSNEFNKMNYGMETIPDEYVDSKTHKLNSKFYQDIKDEKQNMFDVQLNIDGKSFPPLIRAMAVLGNQIVELSKQAGMDKEGMPLEEFSNLFGNLGDRSAGGLEFRQNYMPGSGDDDFFSNMISLKNSERIFANTEILKERAVVSHWDKDNPTGVVDVMTNNLKAIRHLFKKTSTLAGAGAIRKIVEEQKPMVKNNKGLEDVLTTAKYFSDKIIHAESREAKQINPAIMAIKRYASATQALIAGLMLTTSGISNRLNASITRWLQFGMVDSVRIKRNFNEALAAQGDLGEIARAIDYKYNSFYNQAKISDFLMQRSQKNYDNAYKGFQHLVQEKLPELIQCYGERNMTHVLGVFKLGKWNFNDSESVITDLRKFYMFDLLSKSYAASGNQGNIKEFIETHFSALNDDVYMKSKEANGDFSAQAKPFWSHEMLDNAETATGVLFGLAFSLASMFKAVTPVNVDVTQRFTAGLGNASSINKLSSREYNMGAALGLLILAAYGVYDKWWDEDNEIKLLSLLNANPFGDQTDSLFGMAGIISCLTNDVCSGRTAKWAVDILRYPTGILSSATHFQDRPENDEKIRSVWKRLEWSLHPIDTGVNLYEAITDGVWNEDAYEFRNSLGRPGFMLLADDRNKVWRMGKQSVVALNFIADGLMQDRDDYIQAGLDVAQGEVLNILNMTWRTHKEPYIGYTAGTQMWKYNSQKRFWRDYQERNINKVPIALLKEAQQKEFAAEAMSNELKRKYRFSPRSQVLRNLEYNNAKLKRAAQYQQIQNLYQTM